MNVCILDWFFIFLKKNPNFGAVGEWLKKWLQKKLILDNRADSTTDRTEIGKKIKKMTILVYTYYICQITV